LLIAITGYGQAEDRLRAQSAGFDYHFVKPVNVESLLKLLLSLTVTR
jgi:CheY-like chemotaxis protein